MSEFKRFDRVQVRDYNQEEWQEAYFLWQQKEENRVFVILADSNATKRFVQCRPYQELKKRPMTNREIFNALKKEDCWLRIGEKGAEIDYWISYWYPDSYRITYDGGETWNELEVEE